MRYVLIFLISFNICQAQTAYKALEVSYIGLNTLDIITTYKVISRGGIELNPFMAKMIENKPIFIGVKAMSTASFLLVSRLIKNENSKLAHMLLILGNVFYAAIVTNNYIVSFRLRL